MKRWSLLTMSDGVDMQEFVGELAGRNRGKAAVVFTHDYTGQREWAAKLAEITGETHIDVLDMFHEDQTLVERMRGMLIPAFFDFLQQYGGSRVLIVSGIEFLTATWAAQADYAREFAGHIEKRWQSPALLFVMQYDPKIAQYRFSSRFNNRYVIDQRETYKL
jgi:hypothetical protein